MIRRGRVFGKGDKNIIPERVLITSVCNDATIDGDNFELPSSITSKGFQDGFGEYSTHLPEKYKFHTYQRCYGLSFLESNVIGPTFLQFPSTNELETHLGSGQFDVLGISAYTWSLPWAKQIALRAKNEYGFKEVWLGGYAVMTDDPTMPNYFDRFFWGYSESNLNEAIGRPPIPLENIKHPNLITKAFFLGKESIVGHILFRRGCPNFCSYCADPIFQKGGEPYLSIKCIEDILDYYQERKIHSIYFSNQDTNLLTKASIYILDSIYRRGMNFGMLTSFNSLNYRGSDGIKILYDKGLRFLLIGLESIYDDNLVKTQRKAKFKKMYNILKLLQEFKIIITTTYMICFEDDTPDKIREAKKIMINELGVAVCLFNIVMPLPSTPMYWDYKKRNLIIDWNWNHWTGNYLVWKHPSITQEEAVELLGEMRSEVNSPDFNPNVKSIMNSRRQNGNYSFNIILNKPWLGKIMVIWGEKESRFPYCNTLFIDDKICAVIDPAAGLNVLERLPVKSMNWVINSHFHFDHVRFNFIFKNADVWVHNLDKEPMTNIYKFAKKYGAERICGKLWIDKLIKTLENDELSSLDTNSFTYDKNFYRSIGRVKFTYFDKDIISFGKEKAKIIHTPGHSDSMCCFYFPNQSLCYVSDYNVLSEWGPWYGGEDSDIADFLESAEIIKNNEADYYITSHDRVILTKKEFLNHLERFINIIEERNIKIGKLVKSGMNFQELSDIGLFYERKYFYIQWVRIWEKMMLIKHLEYMNLDNFIPNDYSKLD